MMKLLSGREIQVETFALGWGRVHVYGRSTYIIFCLPLDPTSHSFHSPHTRLFPDLVSVSSNRLPITSSRSTIPLDIYIPHKYMSRQGVLYLSSIFAIESHLLLGRRLPRFPQRLDYTLIPAPLGELHAY